ncbi:conserved hypothetical protein [gamma proteobacterium NOR5-3]|nr:conserved hypothetical protein [gamma proteobacterium NOR5-3]
MTPDSEEKQTVDLKKSGELASARRRRLLQVGGASVLITASSRPVWAGGAVCSDSALASANLSGDDSYIGCGISAGWWGSQTTKWPLYIGVTLSTLFADVFGVITVSVKDKGKYIDVKLFETETLADVLGADGGGPKNIGKHVAGAYLNALTFPNTNANGGFAYSPSDVQNMYSGLNGAGEGLIGTVAAALEAANNKYDGTTEKPAI